MERRNQSTINKIQVTRKQGIKKLSKIKYIIYTLFISFKNCEIMKN